MEISLARQVSSTYNRKRPALSIHPFVVQGRQNLQVSGYYLWKKSKKHQKLAVHKLTCNLGERTGEVNICLVAFCQFFFVSLSFSLIDPEEKTPKI